MKWKVSREWVRKFAWLPVVINAGHYDNRNIVWLEFVWVKYDIRMDKEVMTNNSMTEYRRREALCDS